MLISPVGYLRQQNPRSTVIDITLLGQRLRQTAMGGVFQRSKGHLLGTSVVLTIPLGLLLPRPAEIPSLQSTRGIGKTCQ